jgi:hypothetical protein
MDSDDESGSASAGHSPIHSEEEPACIGVAVDLDTQTGLKSPPAKRARLSESPDLPPPSPPWEIPGESDEDSSEEGPDSPDSFILDLFHAESSGLSKSGI